MLLLKNKCQLRKNMSSIFRKLVRCKYISLRLIKKVCLVLAKSNIVCKSWMEKPVEEMEAQSVDPGLMIKSVIEITPLHVSSIQDQVLPWFPTRCGNI